MEHSLTAKDFEIKISMLEKHAWAELRDRRSGELWGPSPLIVPESLDIACRRLELTPGHECEIRAAGDAIEIRYHLLAKGRELGFQVSVHDNYTDLYKASEFFDSDHCVGASLGGPLKRGCWSGVRLINLKGKDSK